MQNPKYVKYQANFFPYPQCSDKVGKGNWERPSHLSVNICGSGLQIPPDQDGCVSCNSFFWGTQLAEIILNIQVSTSYSVSRQGRPWKSHLQSLVLSVILSAWTCAVKSATCSTAVECFQLRTGSVLCNSGLKVFCTWMDYVPLYLINLSNTVSQRPVVREILLYQNDRKRGEFL